MDANKYLKINEICKLFNIGPDSVRYYEKVGIIHPIRDPKNNYRLYSSDDIRTITMIRELLSMNFSMNQIKEFNENRNLGNSLSLLENELQIITSKIEDLSLIQSSIKERLSSLKIAQEISKNLNIQLRSFPERYGILISDTQLPEDIDEYVDFQLLNFMKEHNLTVSTIGTCNCYTLNTEQMTNHGYYYCKNVFFYSPNNQENCNYILPKGTYLCKTYKGFYDQEPAILSEMYTYAEKNNLTVIGNPIEFCYIDTYETSNEEEFVTQIQLQVKV